MADTDKDGLTDDFERQIGTNPFGKDTDHDGLSDAAERKLGTDPKNYDTDGDGFADGGEYAQGKSPLHADPPHILGRRDIQWQPTADDPDGDALNELQEQMFGTNPNDPDTDNDGIGDGLEPIMGTDPLKADSNLGLPASSGGGASGATTPAPAPGSTTLPWPDNSHAIPTTRGSAVTPDGSGAAPRNSFIDAARAQIGDPYKFGAETNLDDTNPTAFDSSELVQWASHQAGVDLPDGSWRQFQYLHNQGGEISVEDALKTPGALVFGFSSDPMASNDRPTRAYVAISLGNGKVLDVSERAGQVREMDPGSFFTHAAVVPEFVKDLPTGPGIPTIDQMLHPSSPLQPDSDGDGMPDIDERVVGNNPFDPSDGPQSSGTSTPAADGTTAPTTEGTTTTSTDGTTTPTDGPVTSPSQVDPTLGTDPKTPTDLDGKPTAIDPTETLDPFADKNDSDHDGLSNAYELSVGTDPNNADTDGDGLTDRLEIEHVMNPLEADADKDGLQDGDEVFWGTGPTTADSDGDGTSDGDEVKSGARDPAVADEPPATDPTQPATAPQSSTDPVVPDAAAPDAAAPDPAASTPAPAGTDDAQPAAELVQPPEGDLAPLSDADTQLIADTTAQLLPPDDGLDMPGAEPIDAAATGVDDLAPDDSMATGAMPADA
jgi:hypothetical protein